MSDSQGSFLPTSAIFVVVAALGGALWYSKPLKTFRPEEANPWAESRGEPEPIPMRIWEDPLRAVRERAGAYTQGESEQPSAVVSWKIEGRIAGASSAEADTPAPSEDSILASYDEEKHGPTSPVLAEALQEEESTRVPLFLPIFVPADGDSDAIERRRRIRYAVAAGLRAEGFIPASKRSVGVFRARAATGVEVDVPYEWYRGRAQSALVAWVGDPWAGDRPLHWIQENLIRQPYPANNVRVLGPSSSDTLLKLLREYDEGPGACEGWSLFNSRATAPEKLLISRLQEERPGEESTWFDSERLKYRRIPCTDDDLINLLVQELDLRGVDFADQDDVVVIVSEQDTLYGRLFASSLRAGKPEGLDKAKSAVWEVSYFNGVDGFLRNRKEDDDREKNSASLFRDAWRAPVGPGQLDYLRRQAASIRRRERDEKVNIRAVGVVGTDVYDKQLVLQAMRPELPNAIFFTTDLDARLLHHEQYPWTRNLLIASAFGLELHAKLQGKVPAFRDSYQTAEFLAARLAVDADLPVLCEETLHAARLYEVGRSGAWDLSRTQGIHPELPRDRGIGSWVHLSWILPIGVLFYVLLSTLPGRFDTLWGAATRWERRALLIGGLGSVALYIAWFVAVARESKSVDSEPFAFGEGLSAWPTEIMRTVVFAFSTLSILVGSIRLRINSREIRDDFKLPSAPALWRPPRGVERGGGGEEARSGIRLPNWVREAGARLQPTLDRIRAPWSWALGKEGPAFERTPAAYIWASYQANITLRRTSVRVGVLLMVYTALFVVTMRFLGWPYSPTRGALEEWDTRLFMIPTHFALALLLLFAHDSTRMCSSLIHRLSETTTLWPHGSKVLESLGMQPGPAAELLDIRLIGERTKAVGKLILAPFFALFLLIVARNGYLDDWTWPTSLILLVSGQAALAIGSAMRMRYQAERARRIAVERLEERRVKLASRGDAVHAESQQVALALEEARSIRRGAFSPWFQNPAVQAVLMPFGGVGTMALIDVWLQTA